MFDTYKNITIDSQLDLKQCKETIENLHQDLELLQAILNGLNEGVIVANREGRFLYFNPAAQQILGIGMQKVASEQWSVVYGVYYPDRKTIYPADQLPLARAIKGETVSNQLLYIRNQERPGGVFIEVSASPMRDEGGSLGGGIVIIRDVTAIKQAESAQKKSEARMKAQFKEFPIPTYIWQHQENDFVLVEFNHAADRFTQGKIQAFLGQKMTTIYADAPDIRADFWRCYTEKKIINREMTYVMRTTHENKEVAASYVSLPPDLILVYIEDITQRKKNWESLRKLSSAVEQTADSVVITNNRGIIEYVNPAFEETTGYSREEVQGHTPQILKSGHHDRKFYDNLWRTIRSGKTYRNTIVNKKKNDQLYWAEQTITPMKDPDGNITNFVSVLKDITELRKKHEQEFQLHIAREVQQRLYNKTTVAMPGIDVAGATYSAVETSGDFFDFIMMADGSLGLVVGDVSGHGIASALIMATTRAYLRAFAKTHSDPAVLLDLLNRELVADLSTEQYVTLILARIDLKQNRLDYASAGHPPAYVLNHAGELKIELKSTGIPLGFIPDYKFVKGDSIQLNPGDILLFLTDGIFEARARDGSQFGFDRTLDIIRQNRQNPAQQMLENLYQAIRSFSGVLPQEDDITAIIGKLDHNR